jgi:hypothetical protein
VEAYRQEGFGLVLKACNGAGLGEGGASYLEVSVWAAGGESRRRGSIPVLINNGDIHE